MYSGCTQTEAKVDSQAVESKTELFKKLTTTREAGFGKDHCSELWYGSHAENCVERYGELAHKVVFILQQVATPCIDDHQILPEGYETTEELSALCAQMFLECLFCARI